jgi:hypothetical protein
MTPYDEQREAEQRKLELIAEAKMCRRYAMQVGARATEIEAMLRVIYQVDQFGNPLVERRT